MRAKGYLPSSHMVSLTILGSTGSIGCSTLDVVRQNRDRYRVFSLVAGQNVTVILAQMEEFLPKIVVVAEEAVIDAVFTRLMTPSLTRSQSP